MSSEMTISDLLKQKVALREAVEARIAELRAQLKHEEEELTSAMLAERKVMDAARAGAIVLERNVVLKYGLGPNAFASDYIEAMEKAVKEQLPSAAIVVEKFPEYRYWRVRFVLPGK